MGLGTGITGHGVKWILGMLGAAVMVMVIVIAVLNGPVARAQNNETIYVDHSATIGDDNGSTWEDAFLNLQDALDEADDLLSDSTESVEIRVAEGTYHPHSSEQTERFVLQNDVAIYGGFPSGGGSFSERDWIANETVLDGDINESGDPDGNSYRVVFGQNLDSSAALDGFTITNGSAFSFSSNPPSGAGLRILDSQQPVLRNLHVIDNDAWDGGGGIFVSASNLTIENAIIVSNRADNANGGGIRAANNSNLNLVNVRVTDNSSASASGFSVGGGIYLTDGSQASLINSTVAVNRSQAIGASGISGAGVFSFNENVTITNSIIWGNGGSAATNIGGLASATIENSIVHGGCENLVINADCGDGNLDLDPRFANPPGDHLDFSLLPGSPAIDAGMETHYNASDSDLAGNERVAGDEIDLGPYEFQPEPLDQIYVDEDADGANNGTSWNDAFADLEIALALAEYSLEDAGVSHVEIWVAAGEYLPDTAGLSNPRDSTFSIPDGVAIYGGFPSGGSEIEDRDPEANTTTLSGDIDGDDELDDNSYTVVTIEDDVEATIDGVTISGGNADNVSGDPSAPGHNGGGIHNGGGDLTLINGSVTGNEADSTGGGISNDGGDLTLTNSTVSGNEANSGGGGIYNYDTNATITLTNSTVSGNEANSGGGITNNFGDLTLTNSTVSGNSALGVGVGGGGIYNANDGAVTLTNSTVSGNIGTPGGGIRNADGDVTLINSIVWGNHADSGPDDLDGTAAVNNSIISDECPSGATDCSNADPLFVEALDPDTVTLPSTDGDYRLLPGSPAIDAGSETAYNDSFDNGPVTTDRDGNLRVAGDEIDLGAYEAQFTGVALEITADPNPAPLDSSINVTVSVADTDLDTSILDGVEVEFSGPDSDETLTLDSQGEATTSFTGDTAGDIDLEAELGTLDGSLTVTVASLPTLAVPDDILLTFDERVGVTWDVTATDWDNESITGDDLECTPASGSDFSAGETTVNCEATDELGQTAQGSFTVTVASLPVLTLPGDMNLTYAQRTNVDWDTSARDWDGNRLTVDCDPDSGSMFPVGDTTVQCSTEDSLGQTVSRSFTVTVQPEPDPDAPQIRNIPDTIVAFPVSPAGVPVDYTMPHAVDPIDGSIPVTCDPPPGSWFGIGHNTVTCSATNSLDLTTTITFGVSVAPFNAHDFSHLDDIANAWFWATWARTDLPVRDGHVSRTWMWGHGPFTESIWEPYTTELQNPGGDPVFLEIPDSEREVIYFDKARMEINDPNADPDDLWSVTNGLLVIEMITGNRQFGDDLFIQYEPSQGNVAGDADDIHGPTYAALPNVLDEPAQPVGTLLTQEIDRDGDVTTDDAWGDFGVEVGHVDDVTEHGIAGPFWDFMNSEGTIYEDGELFIDDLFENAYYATGRPVTEAYWANVKVGGEMRDVLIQCFERRCLTYTPGNSEGFIVEAGNVGQHYYQWRYIQAPDE